jgi:hypothetical protein
MDASRQWLFRELSLLAWLHPSASERFVGRFLGSLVYWFGQVQADGLAGRQLSGG